MDALTSEQITKHVKGKPDFLRCYDGRHRFGDIVEIREDGAVVTNNEKMRLIIVKADGVKKDKLQHLNQAQIGGEDEDGLKIVLRRRKHKIDQMLLPANLKTAFSKGEVKLSESQLLSVVKDKSSISLGMG